MWDLRKSATSMDQPAPWTWNLWTNHWPPSISHPAPNKKFPTILVPQLALMSTSTSCSGCINDPSSHDWCFNFRIYDVRFLCGVGSCLDIPLFVMLRWQKVSSALTAAILQIWLHLVVVGIHELECWWATVSCLDKWFSYCPGWMAMYRHKVRLVR